MTTGSAIALFFTMLVLAAVPSTSVLIVVTRSAASGFIHGFYAALGIVCGDIIFILIAITGMAFLAQTMADLFVIVKCLGAAYLVWLGVSLWRSNPKRLTTDQPVETSLWASFISGLLFTLADQKAILFYLGFFPAYINLSTLSLAETGVIISIAFIAVGGVKVIYALMANSAVSLFSARVKRGLDIVAGGLMLAIGLFVAVSA